MSINVALPLKKAGVATLCRQDAARQSVWIAHRVNFMKINDRGRCTLLNAYAQGTEEALRVQPLICGGKVK